MQRSSGASRSVKHVSSARQTRARATRPNRSIHANFYVTVKQTSANEWWLWAPRWSIGAGAVVVSLSSPRPLVPLRRRQLAPAHRARVLGLEPLQDARLAVKPVRARQLVAHLADGDVREADAARGRLSVLCERVTGRTVRRSAWIRGLLEMRRGQGGWIERATAANGFAGFTHPAPAWELGAAPRPPRGALDCERSSCRAPRC